MYLRYLDEEQKKIFWNLANAVMMVDGTSTQEEQDLMKQYLFELEEDFEIPPINQIDIEGEIEKLKSEDEYIKKIICFELCGLAGADLNYSNEEKEMLNTIRKKIGIAENTFSKLEECIKEIYDTYSKLGEIFNA